MVIVSNIIVFVLAVIVCAAVVVLVTNKKIRGRVKAKVNGRAEQLASNDAATVEGARDYYNNAISERKDRVKAANTSYMEIAGKLEQSKKELHTLQKEDMRLDLDIKSCMDNGDEESARQLANKKITASRKMEILKENIAHFEEVSKHQKELLDAVKLDLNQLEEEKERTLYQMSSDAQIVKLNESLNTSISSNEGDQMLEKVREEAKKTHERAAGAQAAYSEFEVAQDFRASKKANERKVDELLNRYK